MSAVHFTRGIGHFTGWKKEITAASVAIIAIASFVVWAHFFDNSSTIITGIPSAPDRQFAVTAATESSVIKTAGQAIGYPVELPGFIPGAATRLAFIGTNLAGESVITSFGPGNQYHTAPRPEAVLTYTTPGEDTTKPETIRVYEIFGGQDGSPPGRGRQAKFNSNGFGYDLWILSYSDDAGHHLIYNFRTAVRRVVIVFTGSESPTQQDVLKMYDSLK